MKHSKGQVLPEKEQNCFNQFIFREAAENGEILVDLSSTGRVRPWREKRLFTQQIADLYKHVNLKKANRLENCATFLTFRKTTFSKKMRLARGNFCHVRLCPMCQWRRACKVHSQMLKILSEIEARGLSFSYIFLTLTCRSVCADDLAQTLDMLQTAWHRFVNLRGFKDIVKGLYKGLEITHDVNPTVTAKMLEPKRGRPTKWMQAGCCVGDVNPTYNTYHPHYHVILAVPNGYFKGRNYIPHALWVEMWRKCLRADYSPIVDVRKVKGDTSKAIAETCKYTVKESDILTGNAAFDVDTLRTLDAALHKRRFAAFGGVFKDIQKELNLTDEDDPNPDTSDSLEEGKELSYVWLTGLRNYFSSPYI